MKKVSSIKRIDVKANPAGYIAGGLFIALILFTLFFSLKPKDERMLLENGTIEKSGLYTAYVVKNEALLKKDVTKVLVPVTAEGSKVPKGGIVATYRGEEYSNYEEKLAKMDACIEEYESILSSLESTKADSMQVGSLFGGN